MMRCEHLTDAEAEAIRAAAGTDPATSMPLCNKCLEWHLRVMAKRDPFGAYAALAMWQLNSEQGLDWAEFVAMVERQKHTEAGQ